MALPLWSQLQRSLDDPETIEEAISRIVNEHNDDPEAHLDDGQSLQNHKHEPIIDHPAGSLLADKATMTEFAVRTSFDDYTGWFRSGAVSINNAPGVEMYIENGDVNASRLSTNPQVPRSFTDNNFDMVFQTLCHFDLGSNNYNAIMGFFQSASVTSNGFGFVKNGANFYAISKTSSQTLTSSPISLDLSDDHVYRAHLDAFNQEVNFYIDGELVATLAVPTGGWSSDFGPLFWITQTGSVDGNLRIAEVFYSRGLIAP